MALLFEQLYRQIEKLPRPIFLRLVNALLSVEELNVLPRPVDVINKVEFLSFMQDSDRLNEVSNYLKNMKGIVPNPNSTIFTNQVEAINQVTRSFSPPFRIIQGPAGYGKTRLLKRLKEYYEYDDEKSLPWECAYVSISEQETVEDLVNKLAQALGMVEVISRNPTLSPIERFANALYITWNDIITKERDESYPEKKGVCLLLDLDKRPSEAIVSCLILELLPAINEYLSSLGAFASREKEFIVIIGGRYLSKFSALKNNANGLVAPIITLEPFTCDVIKQATKQYLVNINNVQIVDELAVYLSYFTGGHPECVFQTLELFKEKGLATPSNFFTEYADFIWENIISKPVNAIYEDMPQSPFDLREIFQRLSVYRSIDETILNRLITECGLSKKVKDAYQLGDILTTTYLINRYGRILKDDITRRLLVIGFWHEKPNGFPEFCRQARNIYEAKTQDDIMPGIEPACWAIEYLFQCLQQYAPALMGIQERQEIKRIFFSQEVPHILTILIQNRNITADSIPWELHVINDVLENDWEFRLYVNFCLRDDQISDAPFQELRNQINKFFTKIGAGK